MGPTRRQSLGRTYWRFWTAALLANVGDGIRLAGFPLLAVTVTDSPIAVGAVAAAQTLPWLVTGLIAGSLVDRGATRYLVTCADAARVGVLAVLVVAVAADLADFTVVVSCAFALGTAETIRDTAAQTAVPRLVAARALERANGRLVAAEIVGNEFVGPPIGSALFVFGAALPFVVNGASLAVALGLVASLRPLGRSDTFRRPAADTSVRAGIGWLASHRTMRTLVFVGAAIAAADAAWFALLVLHTRHTLDIGALGFGLLLATGAVGGLAGSLAADRLISGHRHRGVLAASMAVTAAAPMLLIASPRLWTTVLVIVATSAAFAVFNVAGLSMRQRLVPGELLGRVTATVRTLVYGSAGLGALLGGVLAALGGPNAPFVFSAVVALTATAAWLTGSRAARLSVVVDTVDGMGYDSVKAELRRAYDVKADARDTMSDHPWKQPQRDAFAARLREAGARNLLELGAGHGISGRFFADEGLAVTCVDLSPQLVERCRAKGLDARVMDFGRLEFDDASFDAVFGMNCLLHVPRAELAGVLGQVRRVLRPGGLFYWGQYGGHEFEGVRAEDDYEPKRFFSFMTPHRIQQFAAKHFEVLDFEQLPIRGDDFGYQALVLRAPSETPRD